MKKECWIFNEYFNKRLFQNDAQINIMHTSNNKLLIIAITFINECKYGITMNSLFQQCNM